MAQSINDSFQRLYGNDLDNNYRKLTINDRDNINTTIRFTGMRCFVEQTNTCYALIGGIGNTYWTPVWGIGTGGSGGGAFYIVDGYPFIWQKGWNRTTGVLNTANEMEANDFILFGRGLIENEYVLVKAAEYVSGNPSQITSYKPIEYI